VHKKDKAGPGKSGQNGGWRWATGVAERGGGCHALGDPSARRTVLPHVGAALPPRRLREDLYGRYNQKARMLLERAEVRAVLVRLAGRTKVRPCQSRKTNC